MIYNFSNVVAAEFFQADVFSVQDHGLFNVGEIFE